MKFIYIILIAIISSQTILAQKKSEKIYITPYLGINFSKTTNPPFYFSDIEPTEESTHHKLGWNIGFEGRYNISNKIGISLSSLYGEECTSFSNSVATGISFFKRELCLKKITTPLRIHFYIYKQDIEINFGIQPKFILSSYYSFTKNISVENKRNSIIEIEEEKFYNFCRDIELGIPVGIAYTYNSFVIAFEYNFGISKINKKEFENFKQNNIYIKFGYRIGL